MVTADFVRAVRPLVERRRSAGWTHAVFRVCERGGLVEHAYGLRVDGKDTRVYVQVDELTVCRGTCRAGHRTVLRAEVATVAEVVDLLTASRVLPTHLSTAYVLGASAATWSLAPMLAAALGEVAR